MGPVEEVQPGQVGVAHVGGDPLVTPVGHALALGHAPSENRQYKELFDIFLPFTLLIVSPLLHSEYRPHYPPH